MQTVKINLKIHKYLGLDFAILCKAWQTFEKGQAGGSYSKVAKFFLKPKMMSQRKEVP